MNVDRFVSDIRTLAGIDITPAQALNIFNDRHRMICGRARWLMQEVAVGTTIADESRYPIGDQIVDLEQVVVGSEPYQRTGSRAMYQLRFGLASLTSGGVFAPAFESDGVEAIELFPIPTTAGVAITGLAAVLPTDISGTQTPAVPEDIQPFLRDGCVADGLRLVDERLGEADNLEQRFEQGVALLQQRKNSRVGSGASQIQVKGVHF